MVAAARPAPGAPCAVVATIVAKPWLAHARVLARSLRDHHPELTPVALLADEPEGCFDPAAEPFDVLQLPALGIPDLPGFCFRHAQQPLSYAATPWLLAHLLDRGHDPVIFLKQESLVTGPLTPVVEALARHPVVLTPHLLAPLEGDDGVDRERNVLQSGVYNVGCMGVSAQPTARALLDWWGERTLDHCRHDMATGLHYEQRWLDLAPGYFAGLHVLRDAGINVAHWNLPDRAVTIDAHGSPLVDERPAGLFRFSGFDAASGGPLTRHSDRLTLDNAGPAAVVFERYARLLEEEGDGEVRHWPYAYGHFDDGTPVPELARDLYRSLGPRASRFGDPFRIGGPESFAAWMRSPVDDGCPPVSQLWHWAREQRPDVRAAYPDHLGTDRIAFLRWTRSSGVAEFGVPASLLARAPA